MPDFCFAPQPQPSIGIAGSTERYPVRRIFCVGRNYAAHAREMGKDPEREPPFFFMKPADAVIDDCGPVPYPPLTSNLHHEIELVVAIAEGGSNIAAENALAHVWGYGVGVDLTRRDLQDEAKKLSRPWDWSKGFDNSAVCAALHPAESAGQLKAGRIWLSVNGDIRQDGDLADLIWPVADTIAFASQSMALQSGDLIFTGTPAGVSAINPGDRVKGGIDGLGEIDFSVGARLG
ncbi:MAG TPA: fumarylacetoacetate hydrolase family protein [Mesorhizobium sp.]